MAPRQRAPSPLLGARKVGAPTLARACYDRMRALRPVAVHTAWGGGRAPAGGGGGDGEAKWGSTTPWDASRPHPRPEGLPPAGGVWRRLWREPWGHRPRQGAMPWVSRLRWDTAGPRRFAGARPGPGADGWPAGETSRGLEPDGWRGRRLHRRHAMPANRDAAAAPRRGGHVPSGTPRKASAQKLCIGEVWPLDRSLLMGAFPILRGERAGPRGPRRSGVAPAHHAPGCTRADRASTRE